MLIVAKSTTNLRLSPFHDYQRDNSIRCHTGFVSFKQSSKSYHVCFNIDSFCTTVRASGSSGLVNRTIDNPITDYNVQIRNFCEVGNLRMAMDLLSKTRKSEIDLATYCSILQLCAEVKSLHDGRVVHSIIDSNGIKVDSVLGTKLVFMYVKCGNLRDGMRVFTQIANEKVFLWNMLISEYAKKGNHEESIHLYERMLELGIEANSYTFSSVLKSFAAKRSTAEGERVHGYLLRLGFGSYTTVVNSLIAFYFKCARTESARKLFDEFTDKDVITWNSMISGYVANNLPEKGVEAFIEMQNSGISMDLATIVSVFAAPANIGTILLAKSLHACAIKAGLNKEITFNNTLLDVYSKCGDIRGAAQVFQNMSERTVVSWTSMITGYARDGLPDRAIALFHEMKREGIELDIFAVTSLLHACALRGSLENGKEIHNYIRENAMDSNLSVSNALMDMYAKCGSMIDARSIFKQIPTRDIISWNTMIGGYSKNSLPSEALNLFVAMQKVQKPDIITMTCILPACASLAALDRGREIHSHVMRNGWSSDRCVANALVDMYVKCGALILAQSLFDRIEVKDLVSWTIMIAGYGMHGFGNEAIATFNGMRQAGIKPDEVSFVSILYACSHSGLVDEGWRFFNFMRNDYGIEPQLEHYACMVDLLARSGKLRKAYKFIKEMPKEPDATIWGALLCGCRSHRDVKLAEEVAERVFELEPDNTGYYVLLANIYAEAEKWEEVKKLREKIGQRGLKKNPGSSWIEIKGKVHIFVSGSDSYPQNRNVESLLKKLRMEMKAEGFCPKLRYALINADEMEKEVALCGHSEKLAMAFGILNSSPGKAIRVTKNLRVCGDCHEMAKFMSKRVGREFILRDSNRFHHFKDGSCSCRGYW
ncbi:hypothetical protein NMG60_11012871 [Bertholletia excelsa]